MTYILLNKYLCRGFIQGCNRHLSNLIGNIVISMRKLKEISFILISKNIENKINECYRLLKFKIDVCCFNLCVFIYQTLSNIQNTPKTYLININNQNGHRIWFMIITLSTIWYIFDKSIWMFNDPESLKHFKFSLFIRSKNINCWIQNLEF